MWGRAREAKRAWACFTVRWSGSMMWCFHEHDGEYVTKVCVQIIGTTGMAFLTQSITRSINYIVVWSFDRFPAVKLAKQQESKALPCRMWCARCCDIKHISHTSHKHRAEQKHSQQVRAVLPIIQRHERHLSSRISASDITSHGIMNLFRWLFSSSFYQLFILTDNQWIA